MRLWQRICGRDNPGRILRNGWWVTPRTSPVAIARPNAQSHRRKPVHEYALKTINVAIDAGN
jgi:hypothetical protein